MKVFISLGLKGKISEQIEYERERIKNYVIAEFSGSNVEISFNELLPEVFKETNTPTVCLCASIYEMVNSDLILIPNDFDEYNGCFIEEICKRYKLNYEIYDLNDICYGTADDYEKENFYEL